ncbi:glutamine amidotransferase [Sulfolobus acidocaldarius SUSAZ]|nr:glutamine amidotransferase [Sulfolobus acidocaldarius SUSAZ]
MCRLLGFSVKGEVDHKALKALIDAARNDLFSRYLNHPHGWGISAIIYRDNKPRVLYFKSPIPIYDDPTFYDIASLLKGDRVIGMIHVRRAGKGFLLGVRHNHPYHVRTKNLDIYFAHNGSISRKAFEDPNYPSTDSYLFLQEIIKNIDRNNLDVKRAYEETIIKLSEFSVTLNSILLSLSNEDVSLLVGHYYNKNKMRDVEDYYKMYRYENFVFSSTVMYYYGVKGEELRQGSVIEI